MSWYEIHSQSINSKGWGFYSIPYTNLFMEWKFENQWYSRERVFNDLNQTTEINGIKSNLRTFKVKKQA